MSKTWIDLLGDSTKYCLVDGKYIVRYLGDGNYRVIWTEKTNRDALLVMQYWMDEVKKFENLSTGLTGG